MAVKFLPEPHRMDQKSYTQRKDAHKLIKAAWNFGVCIWQQMTETSSQQWQWQPAKTAWKHLSKQHPLLFLYDMVDVIISQPLMAFWSLLCSLRVQELPFSDVSIGTPNGILMDVRLGFRVLTTRQACLAVQQGAPLAGWHLAGALCLKNGHCCNTSKWERCCFELYLKIMSLSVLSALVILSSLHCKAPALHSPWLSMLPVESYKVPYHMLINWSPTSTNTPGVLLAIGWVLAYIFKSKNLVDWKCHLIAWKANSVDLIP